MSTILRGPFKNFSFSGAPSIGITTEGIEYSCCAIVETKGGLSKKKPASLRKYSIVNQEMQTASIREKIGFSIVALPSRI